ncbi:MAG: hypothetical protein Q4A92_11000 [Corynebacterium sp.]|nr:hypothetical protein [Corynebacterium sp.]
MLDPQGLLQSSEQQTGEELDDQGDRKTSSAMDSGHEFYDRPLDKRLPDIPYATNLRFAPNDNSRFLDFDDSQSFEYKGGFNAQGCSEVNQRNRTYCADPETTDILMIDTDQRDILARFALPFLATSIEYLGSYEGIDVLQIKDHQTENIIAGIKNAETISWAHKLSNSAACGLTHQNTTALCSESYEDEFLVHTFDVYAGTQVGDTSTQERVFPATQCWIAERNNMLVYYNSSCEFITEAPIMNPLALRLFPWHTSLHTGDSSPDPNLELQHILQQPFKLYDAQHTPVLEQQFNDAPAFRYPSAS